VHYYLVADVMSCENGLANTLKIDYKTISKYRIND